MHLRFWVYRRNLSNNPQSPFHSNEDFMQKAGCCVSGFLGFIFLALALLCLFSPEVDKDRKLFLIFTGLCGIFEIICLIYSCIPWYNKYCRSSNDEEEDEYSSSSLLSSKENSYEKVPGKDGITGYQACAGYLEVPSYQDVPSYQAGPSYQEVSGVPAAPYGAEGGYHPGLACLRPLANYEGVFAHQQIPIYQQDLVEPELPPYSHAYKQLITVPQYDIHVY